MDAQLYQQEGKKFEFKIKGSALPLLLLFILLSRESNQCAIRARLGVAGHLSTTPR